MLHADSTATFPIPLANSLDDSRSSMFSALDTGALLREPRARSVRCLKSQAAAEVAVTTAAVASVATAV